MHTHTSHQQNKHSIYIYTIYNKKIPTHIAPFFAETCIVFSVILRKATLKFYHHCITKLSACTCIVFLNCL